jgi:signal transduction histidine kinase
VVTGKNGNVWLGTIGDGLIHLVDGKVFRYAAEDGLPGNSVTQLIEDDFGFLWGGTYQGIFRVSTTALEMLATGVRPPLIFQTFGPSDGLTTAECSGGLQPACWKARDGQLWFSTSGGAVRIDPKRVTKNPYPPPVIIESLRVNEAIVPLVLNSDKPGRNPIGPGRNRYEFEFTGINFTAPEKLRFQWRMDGVDGDWVDGQGARSIAYSGLPPGDHRFMVRARNSDGLWSQQAATVNFQVTPFFWQRQSVRAVFVVACLAIAYLLVAGVMRRKHQRELKEFEYARSLEQQRFRHKQAMENERSRIAAELHDDLGANLTQIQWLGDAASLAQSTAVGENELIHRITRKSRDMVRLIDEIVWAVNPKNDTLEQLVTYVCNFAEQFFRDSPTRCRIDVADTIPAYKLEADVRHHLFLIAKEALHNVAKHGATDRVWVRVACDAEAFSLLVEDKGRGFDPASAEAGNGLANMRNRAELAGVDLTIDSSPGHGTRVALLMKLNPQND